MAAISAAEPAGADVAVRLFARQQRGESSYLVAWDRSEPVGSGEVVFGQPDELRNLHVVDGHRRRGIGSSLIAAAERESVHRGSTVLRVGVGVENAAARRFYERLGYRGTGELSTTTYRFVDASGEHEATETDEWLEKQLHPHSLVYEVPVDPMDDLSCEACQ